MGKLIIVLYSTPFVLIVLCTTMKLKYPHVKLVKFW